jgi:hypothetical protein
MAEEINNSSTRDSLIDFTIQKKFHLHGSSSPLSVLLGGTLGRLAGQIGLPRPPGPRLYSNFGRIRGPRSEGTKERAFQEVGESCIRETS